jgi:hypothetical protein
VWANLSQKPHIRGQDLKREELRYSEIEMVAIVEVVRPLAVTAVVLQARLHLDDGDLTFGVEAY